MSMENGHLSSRDYAREADATRHRLAKELDELNSRLTPGQIFDEVLTYARGGSGTFLKMLSNAAKENPIPSLLIGTGCMLFLSEKMGFRGIGSQADTSWHADKRRFTDYGLADRMSENRLRADRKEGGRHSESAMESVRSSMKGAADYAGQQTSEMADSVRRGAASAMETAQSGVDAVTGTISDSARRVRDTAESGYDAAAETVSEATQRMRETAHDMRDRIAEGTEQVRETAHGIGARIHDYSSAAGHQMSAMRRQASDVGHRVSDRTSTLVQEQPLLVAALGVAVGAAIAALLPTTRAENQLMGKASDTVKKAAGAVAAEQFESAKTAATRVAGEALSAAEREGLTVSAAVDAARKVGDKMKHVAGEAAQAGKSEFEGMSKSGSQH